MSSKIPLWKKGIINYDKDLPDPDETLVAINDDFVYFFKKEEIGGASDIVQVSKISNKQLLEKILSVLGYKDIKIFLN